MGGRGSDDTGGREDCALDAGPLFHGLVRQIARLAGELPQLAARLASQRSASRGASEHTTRTKGATKNYDEGPVDMDIGAGIKGGGKSKMGRERAKGEVKSKCGKDTCYACGAKGGHARACQQQQQQPAGSQQEKVQGRGRLGVCEHGGHCRRDVY